MPAEPPIIDVEHEDLKAGLRDGTITVVDVREEHETADGMIPGSLAMPLSRFEPASLPVTEGRRLVFSCAAGVRSRRAIEASQQAGIDLREHYAGGFKGWVAAGEPVEG